MFPYRLYHCWCLALPLSRKINAEILLRDPQGKSGRVKVGMINALDKRSNEAVSVQITIAPSGARILAAARLCSPSLSSLRRAEPCAMKAQRQGPGGPSSLL